MGNLLKTEWYKLRKDRSFWVLTWILIIFSVLDPLMVQSNENPINGNDLYRYTLELNNYIVIYIPSILAGFFITSEYSRGTMKSMVSSGNSRVRIYFAKLIIFSVGAVIISLIRPILMTGASAVYFGSQAIPEGLFFLQTIGLIMLCSVAFASIMMFFAIIFTDSGKTIGFLLLFFLLFDSTVYYLSAKISFLEPLTRYSLVRLLFDIGEINSLNSSEVLTCFAVPILTVLSLGIFGSFVFQKKEIK